MICPSCQNLYPPHYKKCIKCDVELVKEKFAPQDKEVETVEPVSALVVDGDIDDFGSM
ncbi:MAG: hypothetical protein ACMV1B_05810 [Prevotella sp.]